TSQTDPNGKSTTIAYDSTYTFPQLVTGPSPEGIKPGQRTQMLYGADSCTGSGTTNSYLFSKPVSKTDLDNNIATDYCYDIFGRILNVVDMPNDSTSYPTKTYTYNN